MSGSGFVKFGAQELPASDSPSPTRIYPIDDYPIPDEIVKNSSGRVGRYHFIKVPLLGQYNLAARKDDWCGRTASSMLWNYYKRAIGKAQTKEDYVSHRVGPKNEITNLRYPNGELAFVNAAGSACLFDRRDSQKNPAVQEDGLVFWDLKEEHLFDDARAPGLLPPDQRVQRLTALQRLRTSLEGQRTAFKKLLLSLEQNNPVVLYTGLSTPQAYGGHIILLTGFCELQDADGSWNLWLLVADPAGPDADPNIGPRCVPVWAKAAEDVKHLDLLREGENAVVRLNDYYSWSHGRGSLYLLRANKFLEKNSNKPDKNALWIDYLYHSPDNPSDDSREKWSGYCLMRNKPTPFDADLVLTKGVLNGVCFPLDENPYAPSNPISYYARAEAAGGGFYPLGTNGALHGGIHLAPDSPDKGLTVRNLGPGYIVAARLWKGIPPTASPGVSPSDVGFALVRHELLDRLSPAQKGVFYSLYMHLASPIKPLSDVEASLRVLIPDNTLSAIPWLRKFFLARYGAVVNLDPASGPMGALSWVAKEVTGNVPAFCSVYQSATELVGTNRTLRDGDRYLGYFKAPAGDLKSGWDALAAGAVVTFCEPFLPVELGEVLGFTRRNSGFDGVLHWEIFAGGQDDGVALLSKVANAFQPNLVAPEWNVANPDSLLDEKQLADLQQKLAPQADQKLVQPLIDAAHLHTLTDAHDHQEGLKKIDGRAKSASAAFETLLQNLMAGASFASVPTLPGGAAFVEPAFPGAHNYAERQRVYPLTVKIDVSKYKIPADLAPCTLKISYLAAAGTKIATASVELQKKDLGSSPVSLYLKVPASAATMQIATDAFHLDLDMEATADAGLTKSTLETRWRNLPIGHVSEWSRRSLDALVTKLQQIPAVSSPSAANAVDPTVWFGLPAGSLQSPAADTEIAIPCPSGNSTSLFDKSKGMLPADASSGADVHGMHPVTFVWLLKLLAEADKCTLVTQFQAAQGSAPKAATPAFWGWFYDRKERLAVGRPVFAAAICADWGTDLIELRAVPDGTPGPASVPIGSGSCSNGVFVSALQPCLWGKWKLEVDGYSGSPQEQGAPAPLTIEIPTPRPAPYFSVSKDAETGLYSGELRFVENCPEALGGYVVYRHEKVPLPADPDVPEIADWRLDKETGAYVIGLRKGAAKLSSHFTLNDLLLARNRKDDLRQEWKDDIRIHVEVCRALTKFRQLASVGMRLVSAEELEVVAEAIGPTTVTALQDVASQVLRALPRPSPPAPNCKIDVVEETTPAQRGARAAKKIKITFTVPAAPPELQWKTRFHRCTPVLSARVTDGPGPFVEQGGYLRGLKAPFDTSAKVTPHFTWGEYLRCAEAMPDATFRMSRALADGIEALRENWKDAVQPVQVASNGLSAAVRCYDWEKKKKLFEKAALAVPTPFKSVRIDTIEPPRQKRAPEVEALIIEVDEPPVDTSGTVRFQFNPQDTFGELRRELQLTDNERLLIKADFVAVLGATAGLHEGPSQTSGDTPADLDAPGNFSASFPEIFKSLANPGFGSWTAWVESQNLVVRIPLNGSRADWIAAKPVVKVAGKERFLALGPGSSALSVVLPLVSKGKEANYGNQQALKIEAVVTNSKATFDDELLALQAPSFPAVKTAPALPGPLSVKLMESGRISVQAEVHCCPSNGESLRVVCNLAANGSHVDLHVRNQRVSYPADATLEGKFEAELDATALRPGEEYNFKLEARDGKLFGATVTPLRLKDPYKHLVPQPAATPGQP